MNRPAVHTPTSHGWLLLRALRDLGRKCKEQISHAPARHWVAWALLMAIGFAFCAGLVWMITRTGQHWAQHGLQNWDRQALEAIVQHAPMEFADAIMYESPGNLLYIAPLIFVALVIAIRRNHVLAGINLLVGYLLQRPLVIFGWMWWDRNRPDFVADGVAAPAFHSFPSGHAAMATFTYGFLAYLWARSTAYWSERVFAFLLAFAWVAMVCIGRLRLGSHWPSDILAGFLIAAVWLTVVIIAHRRLEAATER